MEDKREAASDTSLEMAGTLKSILFWQKVIVVLFVVGLFLLGGMQ
tara:strand:+ start:235 stop:369 length:135 start_codon:yes stop_codon:yes gene_type:complete